MVNVQFINDQLESFLNLDATLRNFNLSPFSPLGEDVISKIRGYVTGDARITGPLSNPSVNGLLTLNQAGLTIPYLNVDVALGESSRINLLNQTFEFDNIQLTDTKYKTRASLNGMMTHNNFTDWFMDLELDTRNSRFLVLDTEESDDELYYGTGFVNGQATLSGPVDALTISVDGATGAGTSLKIPISDVATIGDDSFITFVDKHAEKDNDGRVLQDIKGLELNFELSVTPDAEVEIVLDKKSGSTLKGSGEGILLMEINTKGKFNMWGDFVTYSGEYNFKYGGLIDKRFKVLPGGSISWEGDPLTASLSNMEAVYSLNANPALLLENPQYNKKIETEVVIHLEGQLMQPETVFDIRFPDTNPVVASELNYRLEDRDKKQLQALSLLSQGTFTNEVSINNQFVSRNLLETGFSMINQILDDKEGKIDLGISYEQGDRGAAIDLATSDRFGVTVSTQISDRILLNGKIGVPIGGVSQTVVAGDVEVEILLNEDGSLSAKIFNKENEIQQFLSDRIGYTQGVGLSYKVDFNTFQDLMRKIFGVKSKTKIDEDSDPEIEKQYIDMMGDDGMVKMKAKKKKSQ